MRKIIYLSIILLSFNACTVPKQETKRLSPSELLYSHFPEKIKLPDTLHFFNLEDEISNPIADSILSNGLDKSISEQLDYQTGMAKYDPLFQFPLDEENAACILNMNESWFKKQSLLVYNKNKKTFTNSLSLSEFYGGDGGQIAIESWIFSEVGKKILYQKESSHYILIQEDGEPKEIVDKKSSVHNWDGNTFIKTEQKDSLALSESFKIKWEW